MQARNVIRMPQRNPLLVQLDRLEEEFAKRLNDIRELIVLEEERTQVARVTDSSDLISQAEAAELIGVSQAALSTGVGGTECLFKSRIKLGDKPRSPVRFRRSHCIRHNQIRALLHQCDGTCTQD